jgi:hypothetical protein
MESSMKFLKKLELELPYDPVIPLLGFYPKYLRQDTVEIPVCQCSLQHYSQKLALKTVQMPHN